MRQRLHLRVGEEGCYFLSIVHLGELLSGKVVDDIVIYSVS